ncbi:MAG TPA: hypothetical protein VHG51_18835, partial [Longimicrobiaceae bacterium]|nr:hypothetical protein [Longimicrobiaceae bacterium]
MEPSIAPMIVMVTGIVTTGGVLILRPIAKRLGHLLEAMTHERRLPDRGAEIAQLRDVLQSLDARMALIEERQDFTEALLHSGDGKRPAALEGRSGSR